MAIVAHRTTLADFTSGIVSSTRTPNTTAAQKGPFVAEGMNLQGNDAGHTELLTPMTELWQTVYFYPASTSSGGQSIIKFTGTGIDLLRLKQNGLSNNFDFDYWNGTSWVNIATGVSLPAGILVRLDFHIKMDNVSGVFELYVNTALNSSFSGDTILTAATAIDSVTFRTSTTGVTTQVFSAFIVADEDTRAIIYSQTAINGAGTNTDWAGDNTAIDETGVNDLDFISSATPGDIETVAFGNLAAEFATGHDVVGVGVTARAAKGAAGPGFVKPVVRSGATIGEGTSQALDLSWAPKQHFFPLNPATGLAWTPGEVDAAEIGVKSAAA